MRTKGNLGGRLNREKGVRSFGRVGPDKSREENQQLGRAIHFVSSEKFPQSTHPSDLSHFRLVHTCPNSSHEKVIHGRVKNQNNKYSDHSIGITSNTEVLFFFYTFFFLTWWLLAALYKMVQFSNYVLCSYAMENLILLHLCICNISWRPHLLKTIPSAFIIFFFFNARTHHF